MKRGINKIMLFLFVLFIFANLATIVNAEVNSKLQVNVTTEKEEYMAKDEVKYNVKLENNYGVDLTDINIKATIPKELKVISTQGKENTDNITWQVSSIKEGDIVSLEFILKESDNKGEEVILDVDAPDNNKDIGSNNGAKPDTMPKTGGTNPIMYLGIGILLLATGTSIIIKSKKSEKIISVFVLWSVIQRKCFPTKSHHRCNIPLHMQEQDDSDKWKIVHRLFGYILFAKSL